MDNATAVIGNMGASQSDGLSDNQTLRPFSRTGSNLPTAKIDAQKGTSSNKVKISYTGATTNTNNYLGVLLVNKSTGQKHVGRVAQVTSASGSTEITLPSGVTTGMSGYKIFAWIESETHKTAGGLYSNDGLTFDTTPPTITSPTQNPVEWAKQKTISATVADADSGVTSAWYSTSGTDSGAGKVAMSLTSGTAASGTWTSPTITVPQTYYIWAADGAGNTTTSGVAVVVDKIETTAPVISNAAQNPVEWAKQKTISATVTDAAGGSGVAEVWYTPSGTDSTTGKVVMPLTSGSLYTSPSIILPQTYYIWAKDNVGSITAS
ncbi:MAG: hypothetical protein RR234_11345, partial [Christensenella sp.]